MDSISAFVSKFLPLAKQIQAKYKIPALFSLAQSGLESSWGNNAPGNMYFGIKAGSSWTGKTQKLLTEEIVTPEEFKKLKSVHSATQTASGKYKVKVYETFRAYSSPAESWEDYGKLLSQSTRYEKAFSYTDPLSFAKEIATAKYATAENYFGAIVKIMDDIKKKVTAGTIQTMEVSGGLILLAGMFWGLLQQRKNRSHGKP